MSKITVKQVKTLLESLMQSEFHSKQKWVLDFSNRSPQMGFPKAGLVTNTNINTWTHTHSHTHMQIYTHLHTHLHTHTHTHT